MASSQKPANWLTSPSASEPALRQTLLESLGAMAGPAAVCDAGLSWFLAYTLMVPHPEDAAAAAGKPAASPHPAPLAAPTLGSDFGKTHAREADRSWWKPFDQSVVAAQRADPIALQMPHFGAVVRGEAEPLVGLRDGLQNLRITEANTLAARTGQAVETTTD